MELGGKSPVVIYDNADLDSTVESVVDAIWFNQGQVCSAGSKLLIQESIFDSFCNKLKAKLSRSYRVGHSLDKAIDSGAVVSQGQKETIAKYVEEAKEEGAEVFQIELTPDQTKGLFYPPTLITGVNTASKVVIIYGFYQFQNKRACSLTYFGILVKVLALIRVLLA